MHEDARTTPHRGRYQTAQAVVASLVVGLLTASLIFQDTTWGDGPFSLGSASVPLAGTVILAAVFGGVFDFVALVPNRRKDTGHGNPYGWRFGPRRPETLAAALDRLPVERTATH